MEWETQGLDWDLEVVLLARLDGSGTLAPGSGMVAGHLERSDASGIQGLGSDTVAVHRVQWDGLGTLGLDWDTVAVLGVLDLGTGLQALDLHRLQRRHRSIRHEKQRG